MFLSVFTQTYVKPNLCSLQAHSAVIMACDMSWSPRPVSDLMEQKILHFWRKLRKSERDSGAVAAQGFP